MCDAGHVNGTLGLTVGIWPFSTCTIFQYGHVGSARAVLGEFSAPVTSAFRKKEVLQILQADLLVLNPVCSALLPLVVQ